jgi:hypothetical protein
MAKFELDFDTELSPDGVMDALLDFSDRRPDVWSDLAPDFYEVLSVGENEAKVKEGSILPGVKIWALEHYEWQRPADWSRPGRIAWHAIESNFCTPGSGMTLDISEGANGGSHIHATWERTPTSLTGRVLVGAVVLSRGRIIASGIKKTLDRLATEA